MSSQEALYPHEAQTTASAGLSSSYRDQPTPPTVSSGAQMDYHANSRPPVIPIVTVTIPRPGAPDAPCFNGTELSEFLNSFEEITDQLQLEDPAEYRKFVLYYIAQVREEIKQYPEFTAGHWDDLRRTVLREYRQYDGWQARQSPGYLELLVSQPKEGQDVKSFAREFTSLSRVLVAKQDINEATQCRMLLQGLYIRDRKMAQDLGRKVGFDGTNYAALKFSDLQDVIEKRLDENVCDLAFGQYSISRQRQAPLHFKTHVARPQYKYLHVSE